MMTWPERVRFALLAWKAYGGDVQAGVDAYKLLRSRNKGVQLITQKFPDPDKLLADLRRKGAL